MRPRAKRIEVIALWGRDSRIRTATAVPLEQRAQQAHRQERERQLTRASTEANIALHDRRWADAVQLLAPFESELTNRDRMRLEYARKKTSTQPDREGALRKAREEANLAHEERRWADIVKILEPFSRDLPYEDRMRLEYARKKIE